MVLQQLYPLCTTYVTASMKYYNQYTWAPQVRRIGSKSKTALVQDGTSPIVLGCLMASISWWDAQLIHILCFTITKDFFYCFNGPCGCRLSLYLHWCRQPWIQWGSGIFKNSALGQAFAGQILNVPPPKRLPGYPEGSALPHCIVVDEAFPLRMDLMRPYPHGKKKDRLPFDKSIFNYCLCRASRIVENVFGILALSFRVFDRQIQMDDHNVIKIVNATCVLHNYLCTAGSLWLSG